MPPPIEHRWLRRFRRPIIHFSIGFLGICILLTYWARDTDPCHNPPPPRIITISDSVRPYRSGRLTIASLNIASNTRADDLRKAFSGFQGFEPLDILLLQEVDYDSHISPTAAALADSLMMNLVYATEEATEADTARALAILSRYPISHEAVLGLPWFNRIFNPRCRIALGVTVHAPIGAVRIFNVHLDNRVNSKEKLRQVQTVIDAAQDHHGPKVIAGDFNTADVLWLCNILPVPLLEDQSSTVEQLMERAGYRNPFAAVDSTSDYLPLSDLFPLKLDWLLVNGMSATDWHVKDIEFSDHHLLIVSLQSGN